MTSEQEFEMLCCVLVAIKRIRNAGEWAHKDERRLTMLNAAIGNLERVVDDCSADNVRAAEGMTA